MRRGTIHHPGPAPARVTSTSLPLETLARFVSILFVSPPFRLHFHNPIMLTITMLILISLFSSARLACYAYNYLMHYYIILTVMRRDISTR